MFKAALRLLFINMIVFPLYLILICTPLIAIVVAGSYISPGFENSSARDSLMAIWILSGIALWFYAQIKMINHGFGVLESFRLIFAELRFSFNMLIGTKKEEPSQQGPEI
jgi:hypothetical protein